MSERPTTEMIDAARDPRPHLASGQIPRILGARCGACGYPTFHKLLRCPLCGSTMLDAQFGPGATVFSSTIVRIPIPGHEPPYALAYVDLDEGPRILTHITDHDRVLAPGERVMLVGETPQGDPLAAPLKENS